MKAMYLWLSGFLLRVNKSSGFDGYYCMTTNRDRCLVSPIPTLGKAGDWSPQFISPGLLFTI